MERENFRSRNNQNPSTKANKFKKHKSEADNEFSRKYPIGLNALQNLLAGEPYLIAVELLKKNSGYELLLQHGEIKDLKLGLVIKLLSKSVSTRANSEGTINLLLITFKYPNFTQNLMKFISNAKFSKFQAREYFPLISVIIERFLRLTPDVAGPTVSYLVDLCIGVIQHFKAEKMSDSDDLEQMFLNIQLQIMEYIKKRQQPVTVGCLENDTPPDNFREHDVIPTCEDINCNYKPFLRPLIVKGSYNSSYHFLDVQFRLLKEDFIRPLREGLQHIRTGTKGTDVRVYKDVSLKNVKIDGPYLVHYLELKLSKKFKVKESKQFMYGNVLCISSDNFETMVIATVQNRDELNQNILGIKIETEPFLLDFDKTYCVIESKAYFVSYMHTLKALKGLDKVPLEQYIVYVNECHTTPTYIDSSTVYNIQTLNGYFKVRVLDDIQNWPLASDFQLDESQFRALHGALTRQMAIIQGPPGTGKTFVGLQIVKILLHNQNAWSCGNSPILVVCYTNHALDQFLEGISLLTSSILRVGSRSKSEALRLFQLRNQLDNYDHNYDATKAKQNEIFKEIKKLKSLISTFIELIQILNGTGILKLDSFTQRNYNIIPEDVHRDARFQSLRRFLVGNCDLAEVNGIQSMIKQEADRRMESCEQDLHMQDLHVDQEIETEEELRKEEEYGRRLDEDFDDFVEEELPQDQCVLDPPFLEFEISEEDLNCQYVEYEENDVMQVNNLETEKIIMEVISSLHVNETEYEALLEKVRDIHDLEALDRWKLYAYWKKKLVTNFKEEKRRLEKAYCETYKSFSSLKDIKYLNIMKKVSVVGMTNTAAAQYCNVLHDLAPPIVIIEEAAEILEAHVISSLTVKCQHLIMIGDHQQLRPKSNVYELTKKYNLNTSLFERMVKNGIRYEVLEYQHRMKPSFSSLLVPFIYTNLKDHYSVFSLPKVRGMARDLFFVDHQVYEKEHRDENESFANPHEAEFLLMLCRHLILNTYSHEDITIITPYSGQQRCLKKLQSDPKFSVCAGVRISILDNYQGEESNVILLSLVRSNEEGNVGFVKIENRICVALSRAKHGMYIIGNMSQMMKASSLWTRIRHKLNSDGNIGSKIQLVCHNHPHEMILAETSNEILMKSPEGGCRLRCMAKLPHCSHACPRICHILNRDHRDVQCTLPCQQILCSRGHGCPKLCYQVCSPCQMLMEAELPCGHKHMVACNVDIDTYKCQTIVQKVLPCEHAVSVKCHENEVDFKCPNECRTRLDCGHQCRLKCHVAQRDPNHDQYACKQNCDRTPLNCNLNHKCNKLCYEECGECKEFVTKVLKCGHTLKSTACGFPEEKIVCKSKCQTVFQCGHTCLKLCGKMCDVCMVVVKKVHPVCWHKVEGSCGIPPSELLCDKKCEKLLPNCGHRCQGQCGEPCTDATQCQELIPSSYKCPKGHSLNLPCFTARVGWQHALGSVTSLTEKTMGEYCTEICGTMLDCGHPCTETCGHCLNGRLHASCNEKCNKSLVCGHICKAPCSTNCPPCQETCLWKCIHSVCQKKCSVPCVNCKEKCTRQCIHSSCEEKCGDVCSEEPCKFPCPVKLRCGHPCIGFCGDTCPPLCRICDKDKVTEIFFGDEDEKDARFVLLEDCFHVFEASGLEGWINTTTEAEDGRQEIGMKKCPLCTVPIYNTKRYQSRIFKSFKSVLKVKKKYYMSNTKIDRASLVISLKGTEKDWPSEVTHLLSKLGYTSKFRVNKRNKIIGDSELLLYSFQVNFLASAQKVKTRLKGKETRLNDLVKCVMAHTINISSQKMGEISCELRRLDVSIIVEQVRNHVNRDKVKAEINRIDALMNPTLKFNPSLENEVRVLLKEVEKHMGVLGITNDERLKILEAMDLKQGHWYKCPNGHVYCITECGGATVEADCPECGARIGGVSHRLRSDNRVATEMDGSTRSAWPGGP